MKRSCCGLGLLFLAGGLWGQVGEVEYEHRVVVPTTSWDREQEVEQSLERNVNRLAALGFEVGAMVGGYAPLLDRLLERKPYVAGHVDHTGQMFVVMHRPVGRPSPAREYRLLNVRGPIGVEPIVARYGQEGFRLTVTAWEGGRFHGAFEQVPGEPPVEYRVFRTARRRGWDVQMLEDAGVRQRVRRVTPMTLDSALVELGEPRETPADFVWESAAPHDRGRLEVRLNARAAEGFRVQIVRLRGNVLDVAMLKPAGATGPAPALDLDDGPWGGPCGRGRIAGADVWTDGQAYCVAEDPKGLVSNRGFDMVVAPDSDVGAQLFFGRVDCGIRARLRSNRVAALRVARAYQMERELNRQTPNGYRVTQAFASIEDGRDERLVFFISKLPSPEVKGKEAARGEAPPLTAELDGLGQQTMAMREARINADLERELRDLNVDVWVELQEERGSRQALLLGCAGTRFDRERAESVLRRLLIGSPYNDYRIRNELIVQLIR